MYWVLIVILKNAIFSLKTKDICNIYTHILNIRGIVYTLSLCPPHWGVQTLGFRSFEGKVFILSLANLVWVFIGLIACMGLLLVKRGL